MMGALDIDVAVEAEAWEAALPDLQGLIEQAVRAAAGDLDEADAYEVSVVLGDDARARSLNRDWRGKDMPTNVLSFPASDDDAPTLPGQPVLLGDIVLALETCEREARELEKPLADHVRHLLVHGMLHLLGFDHETDADAEDMEREEIAALAAIGVANPYPDRV
ncbi:MAG: rRNA maturation RNase YbeY [Alphaproteobacteria bacterium]|nr:rRNA maturation RNase YbeY [Alphaproteobacteria bacterium]